MVNSEEVINPVGFVKVQMIAMPMKIFVLSLDGWLGSLVRQMPPVWNVSEGRGQGMKGI